MCKSKMFRKCAECNRIFAMKVYDKKLVDKERVNVLETLTQPHLKGEIQPMVERFVPGERRTYETTYICRFCGAKQTKLLYKKVRTYF